MSSQPTYYDVHQEINEDSQEAFRLMAYQLMTYIKQDEKDLSRNSSLFQEIELFVRTGDCENKINFNCLNPTILTLEDQLWQVRLFLTAV